MRDLLRLRWSVRRTLLIVRTRLQARASGASVELRVGRDVRVRRRVRVSLAPGSSSRLELGRGVHLHDDVVFLLRGGSVTLGENVSVRRGTVFNVAGELELKGNNIISYYNVIHCAKRITIGRWSSTNEFVTLVDSRHFHGEGAEFFYDNVETAPIDIGESVWIANKSTVLMGVTVGDESVIAANSVVSSDVPAGSMVAPARARRVRNRIRGPLHGHPVGGDVATAPGSG